MILENEQQAHEQVHESTAGSSMRAPSSLDMYRQKWMDYEAYFDADPIKGIVWHEDAPKEALESYEYDMNH